MKTDLILVPNDTIVLADVDRAVGTCWQGSDVQVPPGPGKFLGALRQLYLAQHCSQGTLAWQKGCAVCSQHGQCHAEVVVGDKSAPLDAVGLKIGAPLLARETAGRVEPLYPAPDDLALDEKHRDFIFAQPSFLEPLRGDFVRHDKPGLRLLAPSSRKQGVERLGAYLTRKGVRVWAERKTERLTEGEHYVLARRLYEVEPRVDAGKAGRLSLHLRLRPGVGFVVPVEVPDPHPALKLPASICLGEGLRTAWVEEVTLPVADTKSKPGRRWRLAALSTMLAQPGGLPTWVDAQDWTTTAPYPLGGKLFAVASRGPSRVVRPIAGGEAVQPIIAPGATFFVEFNDPVRVESSTWILAGGY